MIIRITKVLIGVILLLVVGFAVGPRPSYELVDNQPLIKSYDISTLDSELANKERAVQYLKDDNESRIVWADSMHQKTEYSIIYLHGFSASQGEGYPMHINIADSLDANLYLPRLPGHGIDHKDAMKSLTPALLINAAKEAIAIGKTIGEKVILMGCSTGGTLAIYLASGDPSLEGLILLSPNIEVMNSSASILTGPWGGDLAYAILGEHILLDSSVNYEPYWSKQYHTNGLIALQALLDITMTEEVYSKIDMPVYCGYYYKNEEEQDQVVSVAAMHQFVSQLKIPKDRLKFQAFDDGNHVLGSIYKNDNWREVQDEVLEYTRLKIIE